MVWKKFFLEESIFNKFFISGLSRDKVWLVDGGGKLFCGVFDLMLDDDLIDIEFFVWEFSFDFNVVKYCYDNIELVFKFFVLKMKCKMWWKFWSLCSEIIVW